MILARASAIDADRRTARALAWLTAMLPHMKHPPPLKAFVGESLAKAKPKGPRTGPELVCVMDQWRFAMAAAEPPPSLGPRKKPKPTSA